MDNSKEMKELQDALLNVRKAHRLIHSYQERMFHLIDFIGRRFNLNSIRACSFFDDLGRNRKVNCNTSPWTVDWSYQMNYEMGYIEEHNAYLNIWQISDTGCYETIKTDEDYDDDNISGFVPPEKSGSILFFALHIAPKGIDVKSYFDEMEYPMNAFRKNCISEVQNGCEEKKYQKCRTALYSIPIENFIDEDSTMAELQKFVDFCNENLKLKPKLKLV